MFKLSADTKPSIAQLMRLKTKGKKGGDYQVPHSTVEAAWASHGL